MSRPVTVRPYDGFAPGAVARSFEQLLVALGP